MELDGTDGRGEYAIHSRTDYFLNDRLRINRLVRRRLCHGGSAILDHIVEDDWRAVPSSGSAIYRDRGISGLDRNPDLCRRKNSHPKTVSSHVTSFITRSRAHARRAGAYPRYFVRPFPHP